jgi:hypothetical protein
MVVCTSQAGFLVHPASVAWDEMSVWARNCSRVALMHHCALELPNEFLPCDLLVSASSAPAITTRSRTTPGFFGLTRPVAPAWFRLGSPVACCDRVRCAVPLGIALLLP